MWCPESKCRDESNCIILLSAVVSVAVAGLVRPVVSVYPELYVSLRMVPGSVVASDCCWLRLPRRPLFELACVGGDPEFVQSWRDSDRMLEEAFEQGEDD